MKNSTNPINLLLSLLPAIILISLMAGCGSPETEKQAHIKRGRQYLEQNRYAEARIEFRSALQIDRKLADAHFGLGESALALGYLQESAEAFYQAMRLDPDNLKARIEVGNLLVRYPDRESLKEAERLAGEVLKKDPSSVEARILTAAVRTEQKQWEEARTILEQTIAAAPDEIGPRLHLARYFTRRAAAEPAQSERWSAAAENLYQKLVETRPKSPEARLAYGEFLFSTGRPLEAEKQLVLALEADPSNKVVLLALVRFHEAGRRYGEAEKYLTRLVEIDSDKAEGRAQIIDLHARTGRAAEAVEEYRQLLRQNPRYLRGYSRLAELLMERGDTAGASNEVGKALELSPQDTDALLVRGRLHALAGRHGEALRDLEQVLRLEPSMPSALYFGAEASLRNSDPGRARMLVNRLLSFSPRNPMGLLMAARIQLSENRNYEAANSATQALESIRQVKTESLDTRGLPLPSDTIPKWESKALVTRAVALMQTGRNDDARRDLESAAETDPRNPEPLVNLAVLLLSEGRTGDAIRFAERASEVDPTGIPALRILVDACLAGKDYARALRKLDGLRSKAPEIDELRARVFLARGDRVNAERTLRGLLDSHPDHLNAYFALSDLYQSSSEQTDRAIAELKRMMERKPDDAVQLAQAHLMIGLLEDGRGEHRRAAESYEKVLAYDKRSAGAAIAMNNLAWLSADQGLGNLDQAVDYARRAIAIMPEAGFFDTLGYAYFKKGQYQIAVEQFSRAVTGRPSNPDYRKHLEMARRQTKDKSTSGK